MRSGKKTEFAVKAFILNKGRFLAVHKAGTQGEWQDCLEVGWSLEKLQKSLS